VIEGAAIGEARSGLVQNREQIQRAFHSEEVQPPSTTMTHTDVRRLWSSPIGGSAPTLVRIRQVEYNRDPAHVTASGSFLKPVVDDGYP
jgi:hypothetical protein